MNMMKKDDLLANILVVLFFGAIITVPGVATYGVVCLVFTIAGLQIDPLLFPVIMISTVATIGIFIAGARCIDRLDVGQRMLEEMKSIYVCKVKKIRKTCGVVNKIIFFPIMFIFFFPDHVDVVFITRIVIGIAFACMFCAYAWISVVIKRESRFVGRFYIQGVN